MIWIVVGRFLAHSLGLTDVRLESRLFGGHLISPQDLLDNMLKSEVPVCLENAFLMSKPDVEVGCNTGSDLIHRMNRAWAYDEVLDDLPRLQVIAVHGCDAFCHPHVHREHHLPVSRTSQKEARELPLPYRRHQSWLSSEMLKHRKISLSHDRTSAAMLASPLKLFKI